MRTVTLLELLIITGCAAVALSAIMAAAWRVQQSTGNSGWVDVCWTFGTGGIAAIIAVIPLGPSWPHWRQIAVAILVAIWCLRLGLHLASRSRSVTDDPRYRRLITQWGDDAPRRMFWFLQSQAAVSVILAVSIGLAAQNSDGGLRIQDVLGIAILIGAIIGETIADRQLRRFTRADPGNRHGVCERGLWRWSRHPNYFFEWLAWLAYPVIAIDLSGHNPYGWLAVLAPACMYFVLVHVSGIPPLEAHMLRTRGDVFRAYQRKTRPFFPLPII